LLLVKAIMTSFQENAKYVYLGPIEQHHVVTKEGQGGKGHNYSI
jgi:hypothetical protein